MVRIVPAAIKLPTFVIDPEAFIDEPCTPTACREITCTQQTISNKIHGHMGGTLPNTLKNSTNEHPSWHPASNSPLDLLQQKVCKLRETPCDFNSEFCSWDAPGMWTISAQAIRKKDISRDAIPNPELDTPRCWTERFVISLDRPTDMPHSIPQQTESDATGIIKSEVDNSELPHEIDADAALAQMEKKRKNSLATIEELEMRLAEQEKKLAVAAAVRAEILDEVRRDQEERMEQYYAVVQQKSQTRASRAKDHAPDWLFGACYVAEDSDEIFTIAF